jgi:outer membrane protein TolC
MKRIPGVSPKLVLCVIASASIAPAQLGPPPSPGSTTTATQLPLSGRSGQTGSVSTTQAPLPGATTSVNTINTSVQVQGPYAGSSGSVARLPFSGKLGLREAIQRGLGYNLGAVGTAQAVRQARGQEHAARSALLPNLNGAFRENYLTQDLQALGIRVPFLPAVVGPINYFDLRATLTQNFVDMTALNNLRASKEVVHANQQSVEDARDVIVLAVGASYLQVIAARARVESTRAQVETAKAVYSQTLQYRQAGVSAQIDVNRALVQQKTQEQRLATLENDLARQKINLARLTGLPANNNYDIGDSIGYAAPPPLTVEDALKQALDSRADLKAAEAQVRAAERTRAAARAERLPSLAVSADLGEIGPRFNEGQHTYTVTGNVKIPIWQGGRASADIEQADAALDQRRAELQDIRGRVESDVRNAFLDLEAAASQLELTRNNQDLARETLRLSREKFEAGVSDNVEVVQSEEAVASSDLDYITALFAHNLAKLSLARAMGHAEQKLPDYLKVQ